MHPLGNRGILQASNPQIAPNVLPLPIIVSVPPKAVVPQVLVPPIVATIRAVPPLMVLPIGFPAVQAGPHMPITPTTLKMPPLYQQGQWSPYLSGHLLLHPLLPSGHASVTGQLPHQGPLRQCCHRH